jgi:hypothetical protein
VILEDKEEGEIKASIPLYVFKALQVKGKI